MCNVKACHGERCVECLNIHHNPDIACVKVFHVYVSQANVCYV